MHPAVGKTLRFLALFSAVLLGSAGGTLVLEKLFLKSQEDHFIDVRHVLLSPDGRYRAIVGEAWHGVGAAMGCQQFVLLRPSIQSADASGFAWGDSDQIFGTDCGSGSPAVEVIWRDSAHLDLRYGSQKSSELVGLWLRPRPVIADVAIDIQPAER